MKYSTFKSPWLEPLTQEKIEQLRSHFESINPHAPRTLDIVEIYELIRGIDALTQENAELHTRIAELEAEKAKGWTLTPEQKASLDAMPTDWEYREDDKGFYQVVKQSAYQKERGIFPTGYNPRDYVDIDLPSDEAPTVQSLLRIVPPSPR